MLREIGIKNFVLIEDLRLDMSEGLNVFTGETGAGKSIVFDALGLLLGDRFKTEQVRQGSEKSSIDGAFDVPRTREFQAWWKDRDFEKPEEILIRREGYPDGRSKAYLNDQPVTLATLQELGVFLADVHGQNEHQNVLKPSVQLTLLDRFAGLDEAREAIAPLFRSWKDLQDQLSAETLSEEDRLKRIDIYQFQVKEIEAAQLKPGEEEEWALRLPELKNAGKLQSLAAGAYGALYEDEGSALERLGQAEKAFDALRQLAPAVEPLFNELTEAKIRLDEVARGFQSLAERWEADPAALEESLSRLDIISKLKKKYGGTLEAVIAQGSRLREELHRLENADTYRQELERSAAKAEDVLRKASADLSSRRKKAAKELGTAVKKELVDLGFQQAVFQCRVESAPAYTTTGLDQVIFEWSPNPGEGIQSLKAIASGGEMSRVMLALRSILAEADAVPTLVFDEIDAGIGGLTAQAVGKKLQKLARHHQILCVSHLPQIASCASAHFQVSKRVVKSRTFAVVTRLDPSERVNELARLLGSAVTPTSVQHAKELLTQNQAR
jgi:DNA repair protein RecN (Recombination protein N)